MQTILYSLLASLMLLPSSYAMAQGNNAAFGMNNAELDAPETAPPPAAPTGQYIPKIESNAVGNFVGDRRTVNPDSLPVGGAKLTAPMPTNVAAPEMPATTAMPVNPAAGPKSPVAPMPAPKAQAAVAKPAPAKPTAPATPAEPEAPSQQIPAENYYAKPAVNAAPAPAAAPVQAAQPANVAEPAPAEVVQEVQTPPPPPDKAPVAPDLAPPNEFGGAPYVPGSLKDLAYGEAPEEYTVEDGDTLYDICDQLIDEPDYWPKLWSLNPEIRNPHFIFPRMRLKFFPGDATTPPFLNVVEEDDVVPIDKGGVVETQLMPERKDLSSMLLSAVKPENIPILTPEEVQVPEEIANDYEVWGDTYKNTQVSVVVPAFIMAEEPTDVGVVVASIEGEVLSGYNRNIIVDSDEIQPGSTYTVLRASGKIRRPDNNGFVGYRYEFVGNVKAKSKLQDGYTEVEPSYVRMGFKTGDILVPYRSTQRSVPSGDNVGATTSPEGVIIGFDQPARSIGARGDLVFITAKASPGEYVKIYRDLRKNALFMQKMMPETLRVAGYVRVIDSVGEASLGYIVRNDYDLRVGDSTNQAM